MEKEDVEIALLLEAIYQCYGYDFRGYARASLTRRIRKGIHELGLKNISEAIPRVIHDWKFYKELTGAMLVHVTEMFRNPSCYKKLRNEIIPYLKTFPTVRIWSAGMSTGEEVYSLAILLKEEGLLEKTLIYGTDFDDKVISIAKKGIYPMDRIAKSRQNYYASGGKNDFDNYYYSEYDSAIFDRNFQQHIVFANHNIVTDASFGEMHLILCRNVLIYFNIDLQNKVLALFSESLRDNGFLCLGDKESIKYSSLADDFVAISQTEKIFQKKKNQKYAVFT